MTRLRFWLERVLVRGPAYRLALIAGAIVAVSICGGLSAELFAPLDFPTWFEGIWWAFLRLTDPGYLGDDHGFMKRLISTVLTVLGYVLFMGALIAIMTQWLEQTLARLERGETPITFEEHLLVVGWNERSAALVEEFLSSRVRVQQFLARREGARDIKVVLLVEEVDATLYAEVAERLAEVWDADAIFVRAGTHLRVDHLQRVNFAEAAAVVLPGSDDPLADVGSIKALMTIASHPALRGEEEPPRVVAELADRRKAGLADFAYPGALDVVPSDRFLGRLLAQNLLHPGLSEAYSDLLSHGFGAAIFARPFPALAGKTLAEAAAHFPRAAILGVVRGVGKQRTAELGPCEGRTLTDGDHLVIVAAELDHAEPQTTPRAVVAMAKAEDVPPVSDTLNVLCLGWSNALPSVADELADHRTIEITFHVVSSVPIEDRVAAVADHGTLPPNVRFEHVMGDITQPAHLRRETPDRFDRILVLGSTQTETAEETDAKTIVAWLTTRNVLGDQGPPILVELLDTSNEPLVDARVADVVVRPRVVSALLAHVTLRAELLAVYDTLLRAGGPSLMLRPPSAYGLSGPATYGDLRDEAARHGHIALGVHDADDLRLLPSPDRRFDADADRLLVLAPSAATP